MNPQMERGIRDGWVYFIQVGAGGSIKIGWAKNPDTRMRALQTAHPARLRFLGVIPGTKARERELHERFAHARMQGEWFKRRPILADITALIMDEGFMVQFAREPRNSPDGKTRHSFCLVERGL